jgi:F-type H+-transporting ATPase subunit delta
VKVSRQAQREAKQLFRSCQVKGRMDADKVRQAVRLLVEKKPRGYVGILHHIQRLVKLDEDSRTARVESAVALDGAQQQSVRESLERMKSGEVRVEFAENADLIGGMRVKIGDDVFDGSVRTRLAGLRDSF